MHKQENTSFQCAEGIFLGEVIGEPSFNLWRMLICEEARY